MSINQKHNLSDLYFKKDKTQQQQQVDHKDYIKMCLWITLKKIILMTKCLCF